jgi:hypothetical protein
MEELLSQQPSSSNSCTAFKGGIAWAPGDIYSQVFGHEKNGRILGLGSGSTATSSKSRDFEERMQQNKKNL